HRHDLALGVACAEPPGPALMHLPPEGVNAPALSSRHRVQVRVEHDHWPPGTAPQSGNDVRTVSQDLGGGHVEPAPAALLGDIRRGRPLVVSGVLAREADQIGEHCDQAVWRNAHAVPPTVPTPSSAARSRSTPSPGPSGIVARPSRRAKPRAGSFPMPSVPHSSRCVAGMALAQWAAAAAASAPSFIWPTMTPTPPASAIAA